MKKKEKKSKKEKKNKENKLKYINYKNLNQKIEGFGYSYSLKKFLLVGLLVILGMIVMGKIFKLKWSFVAIIAVIGLAMYPSVVIAQFNLMSNNDRFSQLTSYMEHMIVSFKKQPKILIALLSTEEFVDGKMKECVQEAVRIINTDSQSPNVYKKALAVIENEYKTSRVKSLHKFLMSVEQENSVNYQENLDNLYYDIHAWVTRIFGFQNELKGTKNKIMITIIASLGVVAYFIKTLATVEGALNGVSLTGGLVYQIETSIFIVVLMGLYVIMNTKLNGVWLVEDMAKTNDDKILKKINQVENYNFKKSMKQAIIAGLITGIPFVGIGFFMKNKMIIAVGAILFGFIVFVEANNKDNNIKSIRKELIKEFPAWLRDVSVNLQNMVVVNAITESSKDAAAVLKVFIDRFLKNVESDPITMRPYDEFFGEFKVPELSTSIKTLYALQDLSEEDSVRTVNDLTVRNQDLIAQSEQIRLKDSISGIGFLSAVPMLTMSFKLMADMVIMLMQFMTAF